MLIKPHFFQEAFRRVSCICQIASGIELDIGFDPMAAWARVQEGLTLRIVGNLGCIHGLVPCIHSKAKVY